MAPRRAQRGHEIARRDHGVRRHSILIQSWPSLDQTGEGFLDEIIDDVRIADARSDDSPHDRSKLFEHVLLSVGSGA